MKTSYSLYVDNRGGQYNNYTVVVYWRLGGKPGCPLILHCVYFVLLYHMQYWYGLPEEIVLIIVRSYIILVNFSSLILPHYA